MQPLRDQTAIAGIGWTPFERGTARTNGSLALEASLKAIDDAGLVPGDIDGIITYFHQVNSTIYPADMAEMLGLEHYNFDLCNDRGGSWNCGSVLAAAMAILAGVCNHVLIYRSVSSYSGRSAGSARMRGNAAGKTQFTAVFGEHHPAATFGQFATAHMARYGTTTIDFAHLAVTQRRNAGLNIKAQMRSPISVEDHQASRWIVYPFRLLDCCQQTDGAVALVVTSAERARDLRHSPVYIMGGAAGDATTALWETNGVHLGPRLYSAAGVGPNELSFAQLYDPFTYMCLTHIEDLGLAPKGEGGAWIRDGNNALDGQTPVNTHGGLLSEGHIHGLNHLIEAVQQLRPEGVSDDFCDGPHSYDRAVCRQVRNAEFGLVCGEACGSGLILRRA